MSAAIVFVHIRGMVSLPFPVRQNPYCSFHFKNKAGISMITILQPTLSNIAVILFMYLCISILVTNRKSINKYLFSAGVLILISACVISLFYLPVRFEDYKFDLRLVPLVIFSILFGWKHAIPALVIAVSWRLGMGGVGALPGVVFGMILPVTLALLFHKKDRAMPNPLALFLLMTACWLVSDLPILFLVPNGVDMFGEIYLIRILGLQVSAFILYFFIFQLDREVMVKRRLRFYAERDPLTGLYNMRYVENYIKNRTSSRTMYIVMIDVDHFKRINDSFGHLHGDAVLKNVATTLTRLIPPHRSLLGRYGGEEFILFLEADSKESLMNIVSGIHSGIEHTPFYVEDQKLDVTVSIGVSKLKGPEELYQAIEKADNSLYASKRNGRNQISYAI
ncbi:GGDEF domain-containing protein [Bacillus timonensis]|uniref:GGDEF domain-containing protein n=2 Tax=Bacillus timonensis TaxID=1033734 RepID=A0A4S3PMG3_9BACI|nr:GGDEF domain-containing protein [Bacillus timonensis]